MSASTRNKQRQQGSALLISILLGCSTAVQAVEPKPDYVGLNYLSTKSDEQGSDFQADLTALGLTSTVTQTDLSRSGWTPYVGYQINERLAVELGYVDLGDVTTSISGTTTDVNSYLNTATAVHPTTASGWSARIVAQKAFSDKVIGMVNIGAFMWSADYTLASATASKDFDDDGISLSFGLGLQYEVNDHIPVRLGWTRYNLGGVSVHAWELGMGYRF